MHRLTRIASPVFLCVGLLASLLPLALWWSGDAPPFLGRWSWVLGVVGLGIAFHPHAAQRRAAGTFRGARGWLVLGVLSVHGMVRAKVGKVSRGEPASAPQWLWSLLIASLVAILIVVTRVRFAFMQ